MATSNQEASLAKQGWTHVTTLNNNQTAPPFSRKIEIVVCASVLITVQVTRCIPVDMNIPLAVAVINIKCTKHHEEMSI
jgi:hypothetical protein